MIEIHVTPEAERQLNLLVHISGIKNGFIFGWRMGHQAIIHGLLPVNFDSESLSEAYDEVLKHQKLRVLGVFFIGMDVIASDWFIEDILLVARKRRPIEVKYYINDSNRSMLELPVYKTPADCLTDNGNRS